MKLIQQLLEMTKSSNKRKSQAKRRRKKKTLNPTQEKHNPAAKAMSELEAGVKHGAHATTKDKARDTKHNRRQSKVTLRDY